MGQSITAVMLKNVEAVYAAVIFNNSVHKLWGHRDTTLQNTELRAQQTLLVRGFAHRGFAYSRKNYCGNICASRRRSLALSR
jgi:hypothetical protein